MFSHDHRIMASPLRLPAFWYMLQENLEDEVRQSYKTNQRYIDHPFGPETTVRAFILDPTNADAQQGLLSKVDLTLQEAGVPSREAFISAQCMNDIVENALKHAFRWTPGNYLSVVAVANPHAHRLLVGYEDPHYDISRISELTKLRNYFRAKKDRQFLTARSKMGLAMELKWFDQVLTEYIGTSVEYRLTRIHAQSSDNNDVA